MGASTTWMFPFCFSVSSFAMQSPSPKCSLSVWIYLHYIWQSCYNSSRGGIQVRVAVVEDELLSRKKILSYLEMFEKESGIPVRLIFWLSRSVIICLWKRCTRLMTEFPCGKNEVLLSRAKSAFIRYTRQSLFILRCRTIH